MELVKKVVNMLLDNQIDFIVQNVNEIIVSVSFDFRAEYQIEQILFNPFDKKILVQNKASGLNRIIDFEELSQFTPFE